MVLGSVKVEADQEMTCVSVGLLTRLGLGIVGTKATKQGTSGGRQVW